MLGSLLNSLWVSNNYKHGRTIPRLLCFCAWCCFSAWKAVPITVHPPCLPWPSLSCSSSQDLLIFKVLSNATSARRHLSCSLSPCRAQINCQPLDTALWSCILESLSPYPIFHWLSLRTFFPMVLTQSLVSSRLSTHTCWFDTSVKKKQTKDAIWLLTEC